MIMGEKLNAAKNFLFEKLNNIAQSIAILYIETVYKQNKNRNNIIIDIRHVLERILLKNKWAYNYLCNISSKDGSIPCCKIESTKRCAVNLLTSYAISFKIFAASSLTT